MNLVIRESEPFERLNPAEVAAYLRNEGWKQVDSQPDRVSVWTHKIGREELEILLPLRRTLGDYARRMYEVVDGIALVERRSQLEVLHDLRTAGVDVVRVRFCHENAKDGSIPLEQGEKLVEHAREMMLAGACAAVQPRPIYASRKPDQALDYVRNLRLGQTEVGSFVLAIHSPVTPEIPHANGHLFEREEPFERRVVAQVASALQALRSATSQSLASPDASIFDPLISYGVSGNLCAALVGMNGKEGQPSDELSITFTYAHTRSAPAELPREVRFPRDHLRLVESAAEFFKAKAPPEETEIFGYVIQLKRDDTATGSDDVKSVVVIKAPFKNEGRRLTVRLERDDYELAIHAHKEKQMVSCSGEIYQQGNTWFLRNPRQFRVVEV